MTPPQRGAPAILRGDASAQAPALRPRPFVEHEPDLLDQLRAEAVERGYAEGRAAALERVARERAAEQEREREAFQHALDSLAGAVEHARSTWTAEVAKVQEDATTLAFSILEALFSRELELARDPGRDAVLRALAIAPDDGPATIRLNPEDLALMSESSLSGRPLNFVADETIARGGALVEIGAVVLDARVDRALRRVRAALGLAEDRR